MLNLKQILVLREILSFTEPSGWKSKRKKRKMVERYEDACVPL